MGHEARMDARNDYDAEIAAEARHAFEGELSGIIEGAIEAGEYDVECFNRVIAVMQSAGHAVEALAFHLSTFENVR